MWWVALGAAGALALTGALFWLRRRRAGGGKAVPEMPPGTAAPPPPPMPRPAPARAPAPVAPRHDPLPDPISIEIHPMHLDLVEEGALLEFEMVLLNASGALAEGMRVSMALISANPAQDAMIARFHDGPQAALAGPPVDVPPGAGGRIPGRLTLPRELFQVVTLGDRTMFMPMLLIDLRWRSGLSVRKQGSDFMVGTAGQGEKLGPIWLDRGHRRQPGLAATRYAPRTGPAAGGGRSD